jgi:hypothetical protein
VVARRGASRRRRLALLSSGNSSLPLPTTLQLARSFIAKVSRHSAGPPPPPCQTDTTHHTHTQTHVGRRKRVRDASAVDSNRGQRLMPMRAQAARASYHWQPFHLDLWSEQQESNKDLIDGDGGGDTNQVCTTSRLPALHVSTNEAASVCAVAVCVLQTLIEIIPLARCWSAQVNETCRCRRPLQPGSIVVGGVQLC